MANPDSIEALAILRSLQLCLHQEIPKLIIESNYLLLVKEISSQDDHSFMLINILPDMTDLILHFLECKIQYVSCSCNMAAHKLVEMLDILGI